MEIGCGPLWSELTRGRELASQLQAHAGSAETCRSLAQEILSVLDRAIFLVMTSAAAAENNQLHAAGGTESPQAKIARGRNTAPEGSKKRKTQAKWTSRVRLGSGPGAEGPVEDGHGWRKYGQKEILGAKHPRGYYRCTHSKSQGCPAVKQMQISEDDPLVFTVTYRGTHTCQGKQHPRADTPSARNQDLLMSFRTGLKVKTDGGSEDAMHSDMSTPSDLSFSFPSAPAESAKPETLATFSPSSTVDNCFFGSEGLSSAFISPTTSESNYFCGYGGPESDFTETVSAATDSCMFDTDMWLDTAVDLDQEFQFDNYSFHP